MNTPDSFEAGEFVEHEPGVGDAYRERLLDVHLRGWDDDVSVRELNDLRVTGVVDRDNHVSVACEVLGETGVEAAFDAESR